MRYIASLDGIRAIAIIAVLAFHVSPASFRGGFTGVDVFFVLSGFLITSILLHDRSDGSLSLREFYLRRIQRLLPNIIVTVLAVLLLWDLLLAPGAARATGGHGLWTLFSCSNIYIWQFLGGYWGESAEWSPLTHTWSLGIEEQFYLFFPSALLLLIRFQPRKVSFWLAAAAALSFGLCLFRTATHPVSTFYCLPSRVWELLIGAVLAACRSPLRPDENLPRSRLGAKARAVIGWTGLGIILNGFLFIGEDSVFPGWVAAIPTLGAACLVWSVADGESGLTRFLSSRFMVGTGKLSYSLYLWHWPLITLGKVEASLHGVAPLVGAMAGGIVGVVMGWLAYVCVEQPLRKRGTGWQRRMATIAAGFTLVALFSVFMASRPRVADPAHRFDTGTFSIKLYDAGGAPEPQLATSDRLYDMALPSVPPHPKDPWRSGGILRLYGGGHPQVVVLGSSHALMYSRLIDDICERLGVSVAFLGAGSGTPVFFEATVNRNFATELEASEFDEARRKWLRQWRPELVLLIDRWDLRADTAESFDLKFRAFLKEISPLTSQVVFVAQVPVHQLGTANLREKVTFRMGKGNALPSLKPDWKDPLRKQIVAKVESVAADFKHLRVLRADLPFYQKDGSIRYAERRSFLYADGDHLSDAGAEVVRALFQSVILDARLHVSSR